MIDEQHRNMQADEFMARIHREVLQSGTAESASFPLESRVAIGYGEFDWQQIDANIDVAEGYANAGTILLPLLRFHFIIRWFARLIGRLILYASKIITIPQMHYNRSVLQALRLIRNGAYVTQKNVNQRSEWINEVIENTRNHVNDLEKKLQKNTELIRENQQLLSYLKADSVLHDRRLDVFLEEARKRLPDTFSDDQLESLTNESYNLLDPLYLAFEDRFRGKREEIKNRLKVYLPKIVRAKAGTLDRPILDIGCGRGEWLELIKEENLIGRGLDLNRALIEENRVRGFDVIEGEAIEFLSTLPDNSLGALTAYHFIEHLPFQQLIKFLDETVRVLKSNGISIFETPNPENLLVSGYHFYADPTHRNPIPCYVMKFITEHRGLCRVEILKLHPFPEAFKLSGSETAERFNELFYGPRDYGIIGYKP